jgi:predicted DNA binding CopG/RHH family protein
MMQMDKYNPEETELMASYEADEWQSVDNVQSDMKRYREYAQATFRKDRSVNILISTKDLQEIQKRALLEGIPYQTLMASILHKYISGLLADLTK